MTLNGVMAVTLRYFTEFDKHALQDNRVDLWRNLCTSLLYFVQCGRKWHSLFYASTSSNINRFSKLFHCQNQEKICNRLLRSLKIPPNLKRVATLPCEMSSVLQATTENKTTSVTTHYNNNKKQRVYYLSYCLK